MIRRLGIAVLAMGATLAFSYGVAFGAGHGTSGDDDDSPSKINGSIEIAPGAHKGDLSTVNGSVLVGSSAIVGRVNTVNGDLKFESGVTAKAATTVNGSINVHDGAHLEGSVHAVNGSLHVKSAEVSGDVTNVNGSIHVDSSHVGGSIDTSAGSITLGPNAHIDGNVVVEKDNSWHFGFSSVPPEPHVVIGPGTVVKGTMRFERPVKLYVSDHATIGTVQGAEVIKFSGDHPPE
jgi:cytoskeletal protein CcmA (bactofilin family)